MAFPITPRTKLWPKRGVVRRRSISVGWTLLLSVLTSFVPTSAALGGNRYVDTVPRPGSFQLARGGEVATIFVYAGDPGVLRAAKDLQADIKRVTGKNAALQEGTAERIPNAIIIGTLGQSAVIDKMVRDRKIVPKEISGKWESWLVQVVARPMAGIDRALVIAGSDKRGTIYGIYDLSEQIGVSPWYWWADVPVAHKDALFIKAGRYVEGPPAVKYRGIFLNDEAPSLTGWVKEKFGDYNHKFYEKVFELILRLKGNYLWPAMWNNAFSEDDPLNAKLANEYGIVMGTSHHEPLMRAHKEWRDHGKGPWDYTANADVLRNFWAGGVERSKEFESIITIGMRGNGDEAMVKGGNMADNVALLEKIVADQRKIVAEKMGRDAASVPQDWALYKEVQEYYENGMRVPDDVTLLWADDNWGNLRRLPTDEERKRSGGAGIYYHFDYVGGPRSYKWLNTVPITKVWEQMDLAYRYGADRIWIVNVGDLKPMEFPIEFFLDLAWSPDRWPKERTQEFTRLWAAREFGPKYAADIADIVSKYTKYNGRRKPELLTADTLGLVDYQEADRVMEEWKAITDKAEEIDHNLPENARDAFFQLVLYPTKASAQVAELYVSVGRNQLYTRQGRASANDFAAKARELFQADADLSKQYHALGNGKWDHMMDQPHIGYTAWHDPPANIMPVVQEIDVPVAAKLGVAVEGSADAWPPGPGKATLPKFDSFNRQKRYIDVFNQGRTPFQFSATPDAPWIILSASQGKVEKDQRLWVRVDWSKAPKGTATGSVKIASEGGAAEVTVGLEAFNPVGPGTASFRGFVEGDGYVSVEAEHYTNKIDAVGVRWEKIADYGRTLSSMAPFPTMAASVAPLRNSPCLEYKMYLFHAGKVEVEAITAPSLNFVPGRGLRYAISFDDQPPQTIDVLARNSPADWAHSVEDSVRKSRSFHTLDKPGPHILKVWMVDPGVVLQKLIVDLGGVKPSYLGPPESFRRTAVANHAPGPRTAALLAGR